MPATISTSQGASYVVAALGVVGDDGGVDGVARADFPASRMSCFFILL
jgi:hypothetical protein